MLRQIFKTGNLRLWGEYKKKLRKEHKLSYLFWECTMNCNFYCKHCGSNAGKKRFDNHISAELMKKVFKETAENFKSKEITIAVTGGEPLLRQDLFEIMGYASSLGFKWGMVTNGFLVTESVIEKMRNSGMKTIVVSIDGIGDLHDELRGVKGAYTQAINAIGLLAKEKFIQELQITTVISKKNIHLLEEMYKEFSKLGIDSWRMINVDPIGRAEINKELLLSGKELKVLLDFIKEKRKNQKKIKVLYGCSGFLGTEYEGEVRDRYFICNTGINTASILYNGDIYVCPNVPRRKEWIQGNIRSDSFVDVWNNKFQLFRDENRTWCEKCSKCEWWKECLGNGFHLWDAEKKEPKICHLDMITKENNSGGR
jgi:radical SAM protein with 4Fe4S-binding SPASM domain